MVIITILFGLFDLMPMSVGLCATDDTGLNMCHDGGCNYIEAINTSQYCDCAFSEDTMHGKYCGVYNNVCHEDLPCGFNGTCQSGIGHKICTCPNNKFGVHCQIEISPGKSNNLYLKIKIIIYKLVNILK